MSKFTLLITYDYLEFPLFEVTYSSALDASCLRQLERSSHPRDSYHVEEYGTVLPV